MPCLTQAEPALRRAATLFAVAGAVAIVSAWLPAAPPGAGLPFTMLGLLDLAIAGVLRFVAPVRRSRVAVIAMAPLALAVIDAFALLGGIEPYAYPLFFVVVAVWVGLSLPRGASLKLAPLSAVAYVAPLVATGDADDAARTVLAVITVCVLVGEVVARAVERLELAAGELELASVRDELTGLGNRRRGMAELARLAPGDALIMVDLDCFKEINDRFGHAEGDRILRRLGEVLRDSVRAPDVATRIGGDEFLVVAQGAGDRGAAVATRLLERWRGAGVPTTLSAGVAVHEAGEAPRETLARADAALYEAKRAGRDRVGVAAAPAARAVAA
jgi:diguanylate cyclase (GGDEF)-like protein